MNTKADHQHGDHPNQVAHAAKGLIFYALKADGTYTTHTSRAEATTAAGEGGVVAKRNPHLTPAEAVAQDTAEVAAPAA